MRQAAEEYRRVVIEKGLVPVDTHPQQIESPVSAEQPEKKVEDVEEKPEEKVVITEEKSAKDLYPKNFTTEKLHQTQLI